MKWICAGIVAVIAAAPQEKAAVKDFAWLAGAWEGPSGGGTFEEHWTTPVGGVMIGMGRMIQGEKTVFTEFIKLVETPDGIEYRVQPDGRKEVAFKLASRTAEEAIFENPGHDFPRKIGYRKEKDGLLAWIEGQQGGRDAKMEFRLKKKSS
jgi:hypothetical protein